MFVSIPARCCNCFADETCIDWCISFIKLAVCSAVFFISALNWVCNLSCPNNSSPVSWLIRIYPFSVPLRCSLRKSKPKPLLIAFHFFKNSCISPILPFIALPKSPTSWEDWRAKPSLSPMLRSPASLSFFCKSLKASATYSSYTICFPNLPIIFPTDLAKLSKASSPFCNAVYTLLVISLPSSPKVLCI